MHMISFVAVNIWAILAAGVAGSVLGMAWYHPKVFGAGWMRMTGVTPDMMEAGKKHMPASFGVALIANLVMAYVIAQALMAFGIATAGSAVLLVGILWLGLIAPPLLSPVLWEQKPLALFGINAGFWLVSPAVMALLLIALS